MKNMMNTLKSSEGIKENVESANQLKIYKSVSLMKKR